MEVVCVIASEKGEQTDGGIRLFGQHRHISPMFIRGGPRLDNTLHCAFMPQPKKPKEDGCGLMKFKVGAVGSGLCNRIREREQTDGGNLWPRQWEENAGKCSFAETARELPNN